jgi:hypothetical protein
MEGEGIIAQGREIVVPHIRRRNNSRRKRNSAVVT